MTSHPTSAAPPVAASTGADDGLGWLLTDFVDRVPGTEGAFLASRDGLNLAAAGLTTDQADRCAALAASLYSLGRGAGEIKPPTGGQVQQILIQHDARYLFAMSARDQNAPETVRQAPSNPHAVGCVLGVLAVPDADTRIVAHEMAALITSVAEHLVTATRATTTATSMNDAGPGDGQ